MINRRDKAIGFACGMSAYLAWGFVALFFALITDSGVHPQTLLAHRIVWSLVFCLVLVFGLKRHKELWRVITDPKRVRLLAITSVLMAINWLAFIYAVDTRRLAEASLGYFILPLVSIVLGLIFLKERLKWIQWICVGLASVGVSMIVMANGVVPWIAIAVSMSFGIYGLLRKLFHVGPIVGMTVETAVLCPLAIIYLTIYPGTMTFPPVIWILLMMAGAITAILLILYARAAQSLKLTTLGFMQYVAPTCQLMTSIFIRDEPMSGEKLLGFVPIWVALAVFSIHAAFDSRRTARSGIVSAPGADSSMVRARDS